MPITAGNTTVSLELDENNLNEIDYNGRTAMLVGANRKDKLLHLGAQLREKMPQDMLTKLSDSLTKLIDDDIDDPNLVDRKDGIAVLTALERLKEFLKKTSPFVKELRNAVGFYDE